MRLWRDSRGEQVVRFRSRFCVTCECRAGQGSFVAAGGAHGDECPGLSVSLPLFDRVGEISRNCGLQGVAPVLHERDMEKCAKSHESRLPDRGTKKSRGKTVKMPTQEQELCTRRSQRSPKRAKILLDGSTSPTEAEITNFSADGMFVAMADPPEPGSVVTFECRLDRGEVRGMGQVKWSRAADEAIPGFPSGVGIEFVAVRDNTTVLKQADILQRRSSEDSAPKSSPDRTVGSALRRLVRLVDRRIFGELSLPESSE